jgi:hypothetical protein
LSRPATLHADFNLSFARSVLTTPTLICIWAGTLHVVVSPAMTEDERSRPSESPRFNRLLSSVLGSPFVTTSDLPAADADLIRRLNHSTDLEPVDGAFVAVPRVETVTRPPSPTPSFATDTFSLINWPESAERFSALPRPSLSDAAPSCSFVSSGSRRSLPYHGLALPQTPYNTVRTSNSNSMKGSRNFNLLPRLWEVLRESSPTKKGKRRADIPLGDLWNELGGAGYIDYANLPPLDGEEGELIDDEACFIDVRAVTGIGEFLTVCFGCTLSLLRRVKSRSMSFLPLYRSRVHKKWSDLGPAEFRDDVLLSVRFSGSYSTFQILRL